MVVPFRVERDFADQLSLWRDDVDVIIDDVEQECLTHVFPADVEMAQLAEVAQRDVAAVVDGVFPDA